MRGKFKACEYQNVILLIIVVRRLECVLIKCRENKKAGKSHCSANSDSLEERLIENGQWVL
ncbi:MAG TPA: hypothetical protein VKN18_17485 [Blastocatellia bacterium]|nr:hypothetical protein [Blastocatellia bacterium]